MRYNQPIQRLQRDSRYYHARELLHHLLHHTIPPDTTLASVFGSSGTTLAKRLIAEFIASGVPAHLQPRHHVDNAPTEISTKRSQLESDKLYQEIQVRLLQWETPDVTSLAHFYGEYAPTVRRIFSMFLDARLRRKCGVPTAAHLNRVGALAWSMGIDEGPAHTFTAIGALHDTIEDLLNRTRDGNGKPYGLEGYDAFVETFIPAELRESIILLTNHYDLILDYLRRGLARQEKAVSQKTVVPLLEEMIQRSPKALTEYLTRMHQYLSTLETDQEYSETAQWYFYRELYIHNMAETAHRHSNYRTYETKALDLADNAHGRDALAMSGRIKNLIKMDIWARKGYALKSSWSPLNNHIMELEEDALVHAEHLIIRDLLEDTSTLDFLSSALLKLKDLTPVLFVDKAAD